MILLVYTKFIWIATTYQLDDSKRHWGSSQTIAIFYHFQINLPMWAISLYLFVVKAIWILSRKPNLCSLGLHWFTTGSSFTLSDYHGRITHYQSKLCSHHSKSTHSSLPTQSYHITISLTASVSRHIIFTFHYRSY